MARRRKRPPLTRTLSLKPLTRTCSSCGGALWAGYDATRTITTLRDVTRLSLSVHRCHNPSCPRHPRQVSCQPRSTAPSVRYATVAMISIQGTHTFLSRIAASAPGMMIIASCPLTSSSYVQPGCVRARSANHTNSVSRGCSPGGLR